MASAILVSINTYEVSTTLKIATNIAFYSSLIAVFYRRGSQRVFSLCFATTTWCYLYVMSGAGAEYFFFLDPGRPFYGRNMGPSVVAARAAATILIGVHVAMFATWLTGRKKISVDQGA